MACTITWHGVDLTFESIFPRTAVEAERITVDKGYAWPTARVSSQGRNLCYRYKFDVTARFDDPWSAEDFLARTLADLLAFETEDDMALVIGDNLIVRRYPACRLESFERSEPRDYGDAMRVSGVLTFVSDSQVEDETPG